MYFTFPQKAFNLPPNQCPVHMSDEQICNSCGVRLTMKHSTEFPCPKCGETRIGRCAQCRDQSVAYKCPACGFKGP